MAKTEPEKPARKTRRERWEARADRREDWAGGRASKASTAFLGARTGEEHTGIPMGQPILAGHHSERRHRRAIEKTDASMRRGMEHSAKAKQHQSAADTIRSRLKSSIFSDDATAADDLEARALINEKAADFEGEIQKVWKRATKRDGSTDEVVAAGLAAIAAIPGMTAARLGNARNTIRMNPIWALGSGGVARAQPYRTKAREDRKRAAELRGDKGPSAPDAVSGAERRYAAAVDAATTITFRDSDPLPTAKAATMAKTKKTEIPQPSATLPPKPRSKKQVMGVLAALTAAEKSGSITPAMKAAIVALGGPHDGAIRHLTKMDRELIAKGYAYDLGRINSTTKTIYATAEGRAAAGLPQLKTKGVTPTPTKPARKAAATSSAGLLRAIGLPTEPAKKSPAKPPAKAPKPAKKAKPPAKAPKPKPKAKPAKKAKPTMPEVTESAIRGACAAGTGRWRLTQQQADKECKADEKDKEAFGELGGAASAAAKSRYKVVLGKLVKV